MRELARYPEYSILLEDMKEEGILFKGYYHRYRTVRGEESAITGWQKVPEEFYRRNEGFLGMALVTKKADGKIENTPAPPGYQYVGDSRYGQWRRDERGNSFWEFYGKYRLFSDLLGGLGRIALPDYQTYHDYRRRDLPYYGPGQRYGTEGSYTKETKPGFFQKRMEAIQRKRTSFAEKVRSRMRTGWTSYERIGRSRTGSWRGRGGGFGK